MLPSHLVPPSSASGRRALVPRLAKQGAFAVALIGRSPGPARPPQWSCVTSTLNRAASNTNTGPRWPWFPVTWGSPLPAELGSVPPLLNRASPWSPGPICHCFARAHRRHPACQDRLLLGCLVLPPCGDVAASSCSRDIIRLSLHSSLRVHAGLPMGSPSSSPFAAAPIPGRTQEHRRSQVLPCTPFKPASVPSAPCRACLVALVFNATGGGKSDVPTSLVPFEVSPLCNRPPSPCPPSTQACVRLLRPHAGLRGQGPATFPSTLLPLAHTRRPTAGSVILAGVLLKLAVRHFHLRPPPPFCPEAAIRVAPIPSPRSSISGIVAAGLICWVQTGKTQERVRVFLGFAPGLCILGMSPFQRRGPARVERPSFTLSTTGFPRGALVPQ